jgi:lipid-binding SYLF domain-containing protein
MRLLKTSGLYGGLLAAVLALGAINAQAEREPRSPEELLAMADETFANFRADPDMKWFRDHLDEARAVLIVPEHIKAGFIIGGSGGSGVLVARDKASGRWAGPVFYNMGGASVGFQAGAQMAEIVLMVMTENGLDAMLATKLQLGAGASVAAGPVGAGAEAATADVYSFARSKGLFAGVSLDGAVIKADKKRNKAYYGQEASPTDVIIRGSVGTADTPALLRSVAKDAE